MTHDEMIEVIAAHRDGKKVQYRDCGAKEWKEINWSPAWNFTNSEYRIKPEPREVWVNIYPDGAVFAHRDRETAKEFSNPDNIACAVLFREVID